MSGPDDFEARPGQDDDEVSQEVRRSYARLEAVDMPEPPELIDQAVLNRARAAVEKPHSSRPWSFGWVHALSSAAVIALALTLLLQMRDQAPFPPQDNQSLPASEPAPPAPMATQTAPAAPPSRRSRQASGASDVLDETLRQERAVQQDSFGDQEDSIQNIQSKMQAPGPEAWLAEIRRLQEAGLTQQAAEELARFQEQWPDVAIPDDLDPVLNFDSGPEQ